jgi:hypothetical protein
MYIIKLASALSVLVQFGQPACHNVKLAETNCVFFAGADPCQPRHPDGETPISGKSPVSRVISRAAVDRRWIAPNAVASIPEIQILE